jgi:hypothetical protein
MGEMPFASGGTMSSSRCRCRYVQPERVRLPDRVTVNSDGGTEGDGQYTSVGYPAGPAPVVGQAPARLGQQSSASGHGATISGPNEKHFIFEIFGR